MVVFPRSLKRGARSLPPPPSPSHGSANMYSTCSIYVDNKIIFGKYVTSLQYRSVVVDELIHIMIPGAFTQCVLVVGIGRGGQVLVTSRRQCSPSSCQVRHGYPVTEVVITEAPVNGIPVVSLFTAAVVIVAYLCGFPAVVTSTIYSCSQTTQNS